MASTIIKPKVLTECKKIWTENPTNRFRNRVKGRNKMGCSNLYLQWKKYSFSWGIKGICQYWFFQRGVIERYP